MAEPKSMESPGSGCGLPAQRSSQRWCPEMVSVKLEDCSQTLELNVIVKEEEEETEIQEEVEERAVKEEVEERAVKEEVEERAVKEEEVEERAIKEEEVEERAVKEEVENREVSAPDLEEEEEVDGITDPEDLSPRTMPQDYLA
ncbi:gelsolin-related protein of 125 kDa-like isoform X2 [Salmo trutta]|uniref:gelsolin-related protein of 125 kDa-like isoform X2 n=1 Tax=Salmo trutta TaxID=8032 RepID=UPI001132890E|nr:gelsolin-related protein of 125 kDa-like isoform X2 [Salmo trutta]